MSDKLTDIELAWGCIASTPLAAEEVLRDHFERVRVHAATSALVTHREEIAIVDRDVVPMMAKAGWRLMQPARSDCSQFFMGRTIDPTQESNDDE